MTQEIDNVHFNMVADPTDAWPDVGAKKIYGLGGHITDWALMYCIQELQTPIEDYMNQMYPFGIHQMTGGTFDADMVYQFPSDPPLPPAWHLKNKHNTMELVMYQHAMVAWRDKPEDEWYMTRMD